MESCDPLIRMANRRQHNMKCKSVITKQVVGHMDSGVSNKYLLESTNDYPLVVCKYFMEWNWAVIRSS